MVAKSQSNPAAVVTGWGIAVSLWPRFDEHDGKCDHAADHRRERDTEHQLPPRNGGTALGQPKDETDASGKVRVAVAPGMVRALLKINGREIPTEWFLQDIRD